MIRAEAAAQQRPVLDGLEVGFQRAEVTGEGPCKPPQARVAGVPASSAVQLRLGQHKSLDSRFGPLSRAQFDALHRELGAQSRVPYVPDREYSVVDLLPPAMQALLHCDLVCSEPVSVDGEGLPPGGVSIQVAPNCHGTAWEMVRAYQGQLPEEVSVYCGAAEAVGPAFDVKGAFAIIPPPSPYRTDRFLTSLLPGDAVSLYHPDGNRLLHTAVYVGAGLFFEKPQAPYRLASLDLLLSSHAAGLRGQKPRFIARRAQRPLAPPQVAFSSAESERVLAWAKRHGRELGRPIIGTGPGGSPTAVVARRIEIGADGRGRLAR